MFFESPGYLSFKELCKLFEIFLATILLRRCWRSCISLLNFFVIKLDFHFVNLSHILIRFFFVCFFAFAGPPVLSESIQGTLGRLPCNVTPPILEDRVALVIWFKVGLKTPIYRWVKIKLKANCKKWANNTRSYTIQIYLSRKLYGAAAY